MKWENSDKTVGINLDLIPMWTYKNNELRLFIFADPFVLYGKEATEVYNILTSTEKSVLIG